MISHRIVLIHGRRGGTCVSVSSPVTPLWSSVPSKVLLLPLLTSFLVCHVLCVFLCGSYLSSRSAKNGSFYCDLGFGGWFWIILDEAAFQYSLACPVQMLLGGILMLMLWFEDFCFASVSLLFTYLSHTTPPSLVFSFRLLIWVLYIYIENAMLAFCPSIVLPQFIDSSPCLFLICIWMQEWKHNWIFFSRVCQVFEWVVLQLLKGLIYKFSDLLHAWFGHQLFSILI